MADTAFEAGTKACSASAADTASEAGTKACSASAADAILVVDCTLDKMRQEELEEPASCAPL